MLKETFTLFQLIAMKKALKASEKFILSLDLDVVRAGPFDLGTAFHFEAFLQGMP